MNLAIGGLTWKWHLLSVGLAGPTRLASVDEVKGFGLIAESSEFIIGDVGDKVISPLKRARR